jgi:acyl-CoA synthetase (NDP forming)
MAGAQTVLCVAGRTELDDAAAALLARLLEIGGVQARAVGRDFTSFIALPEVGPGAVASICLSFLDPGAAPQARLLVRRFRRRIGAETPLIVAFWGAELTASRLEQLRAETRADRVVTSLQAAVEWAKAPHHRPEHPTLAPELTALAERVSEAIGQGG